MKIINFENMGRSAQKYVADGTEVCHNCGSTPQEGTFLANNLPKCPSCAHGINMRTCDFCRTEKG